MIGGRPRGRQPRLRPGKIWVTMGVMRPTHFCLPALLLLAAPGLRAWSPRFHETQTLLAERLAPRQMAAFLRANASAVVEGARGRANDQVPSVEDVEEQFRLIVALSEEHKRPERLVLELGTLAHQVQLLLDPSAVRGATPLRDAFEAYGDEYLDRLVLTREPFWAVTAPLDPHPALLRWAKVKDERHAALLECWDERNLRRVGPWDELSIPFAQLQLSYSNGVNATANLWIQLWRAVGDRWVPQ